MQFKFPAIFICIWIYEFQFLFAPQPQKSKIHNDVSFFPPLSEKPEN